MRKDLSKIKKHSNELFLKQKRTNAQDFKLLNDIQVSFSVGRMKQSLCYLVEHIYFVCTDWEVRIVENCALQANDTPRVELKVVHKPGQLQN